MFIKPLLVIALLVIGLVALRGRGTNRTSAYLKIALGLFFTFAIYSVLFPEQITQIASFIGVGRGTDLLLYVAVIGFIFFTVFTYAKFKDLETRIARLARAVALASALQEPPLLPVQPPEPSLTTESEPTEQEA
jgi:small membrane protein